MKYSTVASFLLNFNLQETKTNKILPHYKHLLSCNFITPSNEIVSFGQLISCLGCGLTLCNFVLFFYAVYIDLHVWIVAH
ncbi:hypothetical protein EYC84_005317 [Monilinia fructicola]|uniref:Uncharacterized protein n=1 Tax=Monilinia fructicola TaxID=38448 RepID=A0A5M9JZ17_MONFR|nr:hypothetical protein EYC84_005317 [Monilinia fructicola]